MTPIVVGQSENLDRIVLHSYPDGSPKMVVFVVHGTKDIVRDESYYPNGKMDYCGEYRDGVEDGTWKYYWPNGMLKTVEHYVDGLEEGECRHFNEQGKLVKFILYKKGNPVKTLEY